MSIPATMPRRTVRSVKAGCRRVMGMLAGGLFLAGAYGAPAQATPVLWTLSDVKFVGGGSISGTFVFDADLGSASNINLVGTGFSLASLNTSYIFDDPFSPTTSTMLSFFANTAGDLTGTPYFSGALGAAMTNAGGAVSLLGASMFTCGDSDCEIVNLQVSSDGDTIVGTPVEVVPEPATLALLGAGLIGLGLIRRRKTAAV